MKQNKPPKRILIVKLSAIGDVLMATPVAAAVRKAYPDSYIAWVVERKSADVVIGNPFIDEVIIWERGKVKGKLANILHSLKSFISLGKRMRAQKFDVALDCQGLMRSAIVCLFSGSKKMVGFTDADEGAALFYNDKFAPQTLDINAQQRNLDLLQKIDINSSDRAMFMPLEEDDEKFAQRFFEESNISEKKVIALLPATTWVNKHWTKSGWSELIDHIYLKYGAVSLIFGSPADLPLVKEIASNTKYHPIIAAGKTNLKQAGALLKRCDAVVGVDTGLLHMAIALNKPTVGIFGATLWQHLMKNDNCRWVYKNFDCRPCSKNYKCKGDCMQAINVEDIDASISELMHEIL